MVKRRKRGRGGAADPTGREQRDANKGRRTETLHIQATSHSCTHAPAPLQGIQTDVSHEVNILASLKYASPPSTPSNHTQPGSHAMEPEGLATQNAHMKEMQEMLEKAEAENGELKAENGELKAENGELKAENGKLKAELNVRPTIEVPKQKPPPPPPRQKTIKQRDQGGQPKPPHPLGAERARLVNQVKAKDKELEAKNKELEAKNKELEAKNKELDRIGPAVNYYKEKCQKSQQSRRDLQQKVDTLKEEVRTLKEKVETLQARATLEQTKRELAEDSVKGYKKQLEEAQAKINNAEFLARDAAKIAQERLDTTRNKIVIWSQYDCFGIDEEEVQRRELTNTQVEDALNRLGNKLKDLKKQKQNCTAAKTQNTLDKEEIRQLTERVCSMDGQLKASNSYNKNLQARLKEATDKLAQQLHDRDVAMILELPVGFEECGLVQMVNMEVSVQEIERMYRKLFNEKNDSLDTNQELVVKLGQASRRTSQLEQQVADVTSRLCGLHTTLAKLAEQTKP